MKRELSTSECISELMSDDNANWSYNGATALIEYLEELEEAIEGELEFNRVDIRCAYSEYDNAVKCAEQYGYENEFEGGKASVEAFYWLQERTTVLTFTAGIIIADF